MRLELLTDSGRTTVTYVVADGSHRFRIPPIRIFEMDMEEFCYNEYHNKIFLDGE